jgi:hypothetical protein
LHQADVTQIVSTALGLEYRRASLETELALQLVHAELAIVPLPHTNGDQPAGEGMLLRSFGARLTAIQAALIRADPDDCLNLGAEAVSSAHLHCRQGQAIGGVVRLVVSDNESFEAPAQPRSAKSGCCRWCRPACPLNRRFFLRRHMKYHPSSRIRFWRDTRHHTGRSPGGSANDGECR